MKAAVILGTRPEIIKLSPIIRELQRQDTPFFILHTGQHYSYTMDRIFFEELRLPEPRYNLDVGSATQAMQTAQMLGVIELILRREPPDVVLVQGDTNSVLAGALAAAKLGIPIGHVEAGLRSHDRRMPEEINRILTDHMSLFLFAPTEMAAENLRNEGVGSKPFLTKDGDRTAEVFIVGNSIVDATRENIRIARQQEREILGRYDLSAKEYVLLTAHRAENVDDADFIRELYEFLGYIGEAYQWPVIWPMHPRARNQLDAHGILPPARVIDPCGYLEFLVLESNARIIVTDSGGVQEEACVLGVPCVTVRKTTDRPETVLVGASRLAGTTAGTMKVAFDSMVNQSSAWTSPYASGPSLAIVDILNERCHTASDPSPTRTAEYSMFSSR